MFKVGDRVRCVKWINTSSNQKEMRNEFIGQLGTIFSVKNKSSLPYSVCFDFDLSGMGMKENELELVEEPEAALLALREILTNEIVRFGRDVIQNKTCTIANSVLKLSRDELLKLAKTKESKDV